MRLSTVRADDGVPLVVAEAGEAGRPGVLFIHGFAQSHVSFEAQFASDLARRHHLVAFDLRGQGGSGKPDDASAYLSAEVWARDVEAVMRATNLHRPVVCAWSYGGYVAMDFLRSRGPAPWAGIMMVGSTGGLLGPLLPGGDAAPELVRARIESHGLLQSLSIADNLRGARQVADRTALLFETPAQRDLLVAAELSMPGYVRRAMAQRNLDNQDLAAAADLPIVLLRGEFDPAISAQDATTLADALPCARILTYPTTGHRPFAEQPERFNADLAAFAASVQAPTG